MSPAEHEPAATRAAVWARTMSGLRDTSLQVGWVRDQIAGVGAARAADVLTVVLARAEQREERYATLLLRVSLALSTPENVALKRAIAGVADVRGQTSLARFLGGALAEGQEEPKDDEKDVPDFGNGRKLTLGERKSLARKRDRNLLARVLRDPDPDVIRILLGNPALVEEDIVRLCARRPVKAKVLVEVFLNQRWVLRYRVRLALALNPHTPEHVVLQLVPHLAPSDLRELAHCSHTSERVRAACYPARDQGENPVH